MIDITIIEINFNLNLSLIFIYGIYENQDTVYLIMKTQLEFS